MLAEIPKVQLPPPTFIPPRLVPEQIKVIRQDVPDAARPPKAAVSDPSEGRSSLMDAIRKAGGSSQAGLGSLKEKKMEEKKAKQEQMENQPASSGSSGGDLMSDLANKLAMRRKGISGKQSEAAALPTASNPTTMDKISMMIPPPPKVQDDPDDDESGDKDDSDEDWN